MIPFSLLLENVRQAKDYLAKINIDPSTNKEYQAIRTMLNGNDGYTFWFVKQHFGNKSPLEELQNVWNICQQERATVAKFSKPLVNLENIEEFWDEYYKQKNLSKARSAYNKFMREQRGYLDFTKEEDRKILEELADRKDADENFYNKSQRYHTRKDLINAIRIFLESRSDSNFSRLLNSLEQDGQDIRYFNQENNIIIICVDYNSLRKWGGDTSWCIVPSKATFDSYLRGVLPQQFIIFLTNQTGNRTKIGATTNINGYITGHFKNDSYCSSEELSKILKERGTRFGVLLPSRESLMEMPSWNSIPVSSLKQIGFTNEEILSKKELFNTGSTKGDLEFFTQEEIEKYNLLEKTTLYSNDLKSFSSKEIDKRNLWKRLSINSLTELISLKLEYPLLKKIAVYKTQKGESLSGDFMANFIANNTNRKSVISDMKKSHWLSYNKDGKNYSVETNRSYSTKLDLVDLLQLTEEEWDNKSLYELIHNGYDRNASGLSKIKNSITDMESRGRVIDDEFFLKIVDGNTSYRGWVKRLCSLINEKIRTKWSLQKLNALIEGAQKELQSSRYYGSDTYLSQFEMTYSDLKEIKEQIAGYDDIYENIFNTTKSYLLGSTDRFKIRDESRFFSSRDTNIDATLANLDFFSAKISIKNFFHLFYWIGVSTLPKLLKYLKDRGYDLSNETELIEGTDTISNSNDDQVDRIITMIECGVAVKTNYDSLIEWVESRRNPIGSYTKTKLENVFKKKDEYYKKWKNLHNLDAVNEALTSSLSTAGYWSGTDRNLKLKPEQWFDKYWDTLKDYSWEDQYETRKDYEQKYFNAVIQLLAKLGKKKELMGLKNDRLIQGSGYGQTGIKKLCQIIAEKDVTNGDRTYREMKLSLDERKMIYDWLSNLVDKKTKEDSGDSAGWGHIYSIMAIVWYLFDKDKFWRYIDSVTTLKNNVHDFDYVDQKRVLKKSYTVRLKELNKLLPFLAQEGYWNDLEKILKMFSNLKMTKTEYKESINTLSYAFFYNSRTPEDREKGEIRSNNSNSVEKKYRELLNKYITPTEPKVKKVKESKIFSWKEFNI